MLPAGQDDTPGVAEAPQGEGHQLQGAGHGPVSGTRSEEPVAEGRGWAFSPFLELAFPLGAAALPVTCLCAPR